MSADTERPTPTPVSPARRRWRTVGLALFAVAFVLGGARYYAGYALRAYVNRTLDRHPLYDGHVGDVSLHLYRGAYTLSDVRIVRTAGDLPVPLFAAERVDFSLEWGALLHGHLVGQVVLHSPELNFVDPNEDQRNSPVGSAAGALSGGGWLDIIGDLFPFRLNSAVVHSGSLHFRAFHTTPPVDVFLTALDGKLENLTNIYDESTPLVASVRANALAMDTGRLDYVMHFDPFSYRPSFELTLTLTGLDVTSTNDLARAYGNFDFEAGSLDLVVELACHEGRLRGQVKPLFRHLRVLSLRKDSREGDPLTFFWEALVGVTTGLLKNPARDQFGTLIPLSGELQDPSADLFSTVLNVLRNAFVRAYLPRPEGDEDRGSGLQFAPSQVLEPPSK